MIAFDEKNYKLYNEIIHNFLYVDAFSNLDLDKGDFLEEILPKYLFREQYKKAIKVLDELYAWTDDKFIHQMNCFHELMLYYFLKKMEYIQRIMKNKFIKRYFKKSTCEKIERIAREEYEENYNSLAEEDNLGLNFYKDCYYSVYYYFDSLFFDIDFTFLDILYNDFDYGMGVINKRLGVNLDYYFDILPEDIKEKFPDNHISMTGRVIEFIDFLNNKVSDGTLSKLFWDNNKPVKEDIIQIIIDNMMDAYFHNCGIDISREVRLGNGNVDFKIYNGKEKILIEVKKAYSASYLKKGFEKQLLDYIKSANCDNAFFLIACFTDEDIKKYKKFIKENVYTDTYRLYINISYLDVRKKVMASKKVLI